METLDVKSYYIEQYLESEINLIFKKNWFYVSLTDDLNVKNDYKTIDMKNISIFLYNTGNEIKAFKNLCPHRFNKIFVNQSGNSNIICKFHSWTFNKHGENINPEIRKLPILEQKCFSLQELKVSIVGKFIFVKFQDDGITIEKYLGTFYDKIIKISSLLGETIHKDQNKHFSNWKLIVENVIDKSHCRSLHKKTLVDIGLCIKKDEHEVFDNYGSSIQLNKIDGYKNEKAKKQLNKYLPRDYQNDYYEHIYIFPNLTIGVFEGLNFTIGNIIPIKVGESIYELSYIFSKINSDSLISKEILSNMRTEVIKFGNQVFDEDKEVLEVVQSSIHMAEHNGYLIKDENRIRHFYNLYKEQIRK